MDVMRPAPPSRSHHEWTGRLSECPKRAGTCVLRVNRSATVLCPVRAAGPGLRPPGDSSSAERVGFGPTCPELPDWPSPRPCGPDDSYRQI